MPTKSIVEVEESVQDALEALPSVLRSSPLTPLTQGIREALRILAPAGYHPVVELQENGRRKRRTAAADNWNPETGEILITFSKDAELEQLQRRDAGEAQARIVGSRTREVASIAERHRVDGADAPARETAVSHPAQSAPPGHSAEATRLKTVTTPAAPPDSREEELCRVLDEVERQGRAFVALKWFRDDVLASKGFSWAQEAEQRQAILAAAIEKGLVVTSRIPNPRSPFPTTAIRLNRSRIAGGAEMRRFSPVRIEGEPLSSTILRDRGTY